MPSGATARVIRLPDAGAVAEPAVTTARSRPRKVKLPTRNAVIKRLGSDVVTYLDRLSLPQLICLAYGHIWPVLIPGRGRPRGWRSALAPDRDGAFLITETCVRDDAGGWCGSDRTTYTGERGIFMERGRHRQYKRDKSAWEIRPEGSRITRLDVQDYIMQRMGAELFAEPERGEGGLS